MPHYGDLTDSTNLIRIIQQVQPDEICNFGAQSDVSVSFEAPQYTADSNPLSALRIQEVVRILGLTAITISIRPAPRTPTAWCKRSRRRKPRILPALALRGRQSLRLLDHGKLPLSDRPGHDKRYAIDSSLIYAELGFRPEVSVHEGLCLTVEWYLNHKKWWQSLLSRNGGV